MLWNLPDISQLPEHVLLPVALQGLQKRSLQKWVESFLFYEPVTEYLREMFNYFATLQALKQCPLYLYGCPSWLFWFCSFGLFILSNSHIQTCMIATVRAHRKKTTITPTILERGQEIHIWSRVFVETKQKCWSHEPFPFLFLLEVPGHLSHF